MSYLNLFLLFLLLVIILFIKLMDVYILLVVYFQ